MITSRRIPFLSTCLEIRSVSRLIESIFLSVTSVHCDFDLSRYARNQANIGHVHLFLLLAWENTNWYQEFYTEQYQSEQHETSKA